MESLGQLFDAENCCQMVRSRVQPTGAGGDEGKQAQGARRRAQLGPLSADEYRGVRTRSRPIRDLDRSRSGRFVPLLYLESETAGSQFFCTALDTEAHCS